MGTSPCKLIFDPCMQLSPLQSIKLRERPAIQFCDQMHPNHSSTKFPCAGSLSSQDTEGPRVCPRAMHWLGSSWPFFAPCWYLPSLLHNLWKNRCSVEVFFVSFFPLQSTDKIICLAFFVWVFCCWVFFCCCYCCFRFFQENQRKARDRDAFSVKVFLFGEC